MKKVGMTPFLKLPSGSGTAEGACPTGSHPAAQLLLRLWLQMMPHTHDGFTFA